MASCVERVFFVAIVHAFFGAAVAVVAADTPAAELVLSAPLDYQVVQRTSPGHGPLVIAGELSEDAPQGAIVEVRLVEEGQAPAWQQAEGSVRGRHVAATLPAAAGGWRRLEVRVVHGARDIASATVPHVGVGELFVVAGQSNSANYGAERQTPKTGRVATFDGKAWRIANDPQPGGTGGGGSFMPPLGDALVERLGVPVGFIACGVGSSSVREWLPEGATFPNPPTIKGRVVRLPDGTWASKGHIYDQFVARMKSVGPQGFRAVLWHQGESDANQPDPSCTLPGALYREYLGRLIRDSRQAIGWEAPWFVALASYHVPGDEGSDDIRAAQAAVCRDGLAIEGPDSDALKGQLRERNGQGVHFSGAGLREHAARWAEKVIPWIEKQGTEPRPTAGDRGPT